MKLDNDLAKLTFEAQRDTPDAFRVEVCDSDGFYPHFHRNLEVYFVYEGSVTVTINNDVYLLRAGQGVCINSYDIHSYVIHGRARVGFVHIGIDYANSFKNLYLGRALPTELPDPDKNKPLLDFAERINGTFSDQSDESKLLYYGYANYILYLIVRAYGTTAPKTQTNLTTQNIVQYIYENAEHDLTLKSVADEFGYSAGSLSHFFSRYIHIDFRTFLGDIRMQKMLELQENPAYADRSVVELAMLCGFNSASAYYRARSRYNQSKRADTQRQDMDIAEEVRE